MPNRFTTASAQAMSSGFNIHVRGHGQYTGAKPIFVDSELKTWNLDPELLRALLARKAKQNRLPKAVLVVDLYGHCASYDEIVTICAEYGVPLIEDAAKARSGSFNGQRQAVWRSWNPEFRRQHLQPATFSTTTQQKSASPSQGYVSEIIAPTSHKLITRTPVPQITGNFFTPTTPDKQVDLLSGWCAPTA